MKTTILTAALIVLMTAANAGTFTDTLNLKVSPEKTFQASVTKLDNNVIKFGVNNPNEEKVIIKIYNDDMVKVFHRTIKSKKQMNLGCDLSNLEAGTYTCIVNRNGKEEVRKQITRK